MRRLSVCNMILLPCSCASVSLFMTHLYCISSKHYQNVVRLQYFLIHRKRNAAPLSVAPELLTALQSGVHAIL